MEEREVSFGLFSFELNRWRRRISVVGRPKWYLYLLGSTVVYGWYCRPSQNRQNLEIFGWLLWLGKRIQICEFEFRKSRTIKRDSSTVGQLCNQMLKTLDLHPLTQPKQPAKNLQILPVLARAAVPPLTDRWTQGVFIPFRPSPQWSSTSLSHSAQNRTEPKLTLSSPLLLLHPSSKSLIPTIKT